MRYITAEITHRFDVLKRLSLTSILDPDVNVRTPFYHEGVHTIVGDYDFMRIEPFKLFSIIVDRDITELVNDNLIGFSTGLTGAGCYPRDTYFVKKPLFDWIRLNNTIGNFPDRDQLAFTLGLDLDGDFMSNYVAFIKINNLNNCRITFPSDFINEYFYKLLMEEIENDNKE